MEWVAFWVAASVVIGIAGASRGRSGVGWFLIALLISPLLAAVLVFALERRGVADTERADLVKCPECAELVQAEAIKCKHCGADLSAARAARVAVVQAQLDRYAATNEALRAERQQAAKAAGRFFTRLVPWWARGGRPPKGPD